MLPMNSMEKEDRLLDSPSSRFAFSFRLKNWRNCVGVLDLAWLQNGLRIRQAFFSKKVAVLPNQEARRRERVAAERRNQWETGKKIWGKQDLNAEAAEICRGTQSNLDYCSA